MTGWTPIDDLRAFRIVWRMGNGGRIAIVSFVVMLGTFATFAATLLTHIIMDL